MLSKTKKEREVFGSHELPAELIIFNGLIFYPGLCVRQDKLKIKQTTFL